MRSLVAAFLLTITASIAAVQTSQTTPPPKDDGDRRGCDHERQVPTTS